MKIVFLILALLSLVHQAVAVDKKEAAAVAVPTEAPKTPMTICSAEVSYKWKRIPPPPVESPAGKKGKAAQPAPTPDPEIYAPIQAPALTMSESGPIESEVKARIEAQFSNALGQAMHICVSLHQNQGSCLSKKLGAVSIQLDRLDFETKKAIREQSIEDCKNEAGVCLSTSKSEITCRQEILPTPAPTEAPPAAAAKETKKK